MVVEMTWRRTYWYVLLTVLCFTVPYSMHCTLSSIYCSRTSSFFLLSFTLIIRLKKITLVVKKMKKKKREERKEKMKEEEEEKMTRPWRKLMDSALHGIRSLPLDLMTPSTQAMTAHRAHIGDHTHREDVRVPMGPA